MGKNLEYHIQERTEKVLSKKIPTSSAKGKLAELEAEIGEMFKI